MNPRKGYKIMNVKAAESITGVNMRFRLRDAIAQHHISAEKTVEALDIFSNKVNYSIWLSSMMELHHIFSKCSNSVSYEIGVSPNHTLLHDALQSDLISLGMKPTLAIGEPISSFTNEFKFGTAYVLEGSSLGAKILHKQATAASDIPHNYISELSENSFQRWPIVVAALDAKKLRFQPTADAARSVFTFLMTTMERKMA